MSDHPPADPARPARALELRYGQLRACMVTAARDLPAAAAAAFPGVDFTIRGRSGLRFLLDPDSATWAEVAAEPGIGSDSSEHVAAAERKIVAASTTLADPLSWVEELSWVDGPSNAAVDRVLSAAVQLVGLPDGQGLGGPARTHPAHWLSRKYTASAFAVYALAHHQQGRRVLVERGAPLLPPTGASGPVTFPGAHAWLTDADLRWLVPGHRVHDLLRVYLRLLPACLDDIVDPADVHAGVDAGLLDAAVAVAQTAAAGVRGGNHR